MHENANVKKQIAKLESEKHKMRAKAMEALSTTPKSSQGFEELNEALQFKQMNTQLQKRVEFLQKRERELLEHLTKAQKASTAEESKQP